MPSRDELARRTRRQLRAQEGVRPYAGRVRRRAELAPLMNPATLDVMAPRVLPPPATEEEAMSLPPFGRGVALLANAVAGTEWYARRWDAELGIWQRLPDQPSVLRDPVPMSTPWHYKWAATEDLILYGNTFAFSGSRTIVTPSGVEVEGIDTDDRTGRAAWLIPVPADSVWIWTDPEGGWAWAIGGELYAVGDVLHASAGNRSGEVLGRGVLRQYAYTLGGFAAAEDHAASYYYGGALPPAVLQSPHVVTQEQAQSLKSKWREMTSTREPVVLPSGYTLTPLVSTAEAAQLVQSRQWDAELVAMMLGVPTYKLGLPGPSMTYQNIESADIEFVRDDVDRWAAPLSHTLTKWLMPNGTEVAWDWAGRMRHDQTTLASVLVSYVSQGILTADEARAVLSRPPLDATPQEPTTPEDVPELTPTEAT